MRDTTRAGAHHRSSGRVLRWTAAASVVVAGTSAVFGLWLIVLAVVAGWLRLGLMAAHYALQVVPERVARAALDPGWRRPGWDGEELVAEELSALVGGRALVARRAVRLVRSHDGDPGARSVALERLQHVRADAMQASAARRMRWLRTVLAPATMAVVAGAVALVGLSEATPGPSMAYPWRSAVSLVAAAGTAVAMASAAQRNGWTSR